MSEERNAGDSTSEQRSLTTLIEFWAYDLSRALKSALQPTIFLVQLPMWLTGLFMRCSVFKSPRLSAVV
jgi:hypothetical protein